MLLLLLKAAGRFGCCTAWPRWLTPYRRRVLPSLLSVSERQTDQVAAAHTGFDVKSSGSHQNSTVVQSRLALAQATVDKNSSYSSTGNRQATLRSACFLKFANDNSWTRGLGARRSFHWDSLSKGKHTQPVTVTGNCLLFRNDLSRVNGRNMSALSPQDPNSFARPDEALVKSFHWEVFVDFESKVLRAHVDLEVTRTKPGAEFILLDSSKDLNIKDALCVASGAKLDVDRSLVDKFGICTRIRLPSSPEHPTIRVHYETSPTSSALQWMTKEQTAGKRQPYVYSHSEAIHSRALLPCQDTPGVKSAFTAAIQVPNGVVPVLSAVKVGDKPKENNTREYRFEQKVPVPIYLLAMAVGDLESRKIGPRSHVWSEKEYVDKATIDYADTELMIKTAEDLMGPYIWGIYDLLILPPSFPFGGMENPCLTFMTPTTLAGDKSLSDVVAHEISHSWTGNLVTNGNFEHFWLNEGFTMYVERKILGRMFGEDYRQFSAMEGLKQLRYTIDTMGKDNVLTKLVVDLKGVDPDDSFSSVPYEKGHTFLYYLETLLGAQQMDAFLKAYVEKFKFKSIVTDDWKEFLYEYFADKKEVLDKVDWNEWLYGTGMPPVIPEYKSSLADPCRELCHRWVEASDDAVQSFKNEDFAKFNPKQKQEFFAELLEEKPISCAKITHLTNLYDINSIINAEIRFRWLHLGILCRWENIIDPVTKFLEEVGRMKFVGPLFRSLGEWPEKRQFAIDLYERLKPGMMYVTRHAVEKNLKINTGSK